MVPAPFMNLKSEIEDFDPVGVVRDLYVPGLRGPLLFSGLFSDTALARSLPCRVASLGNR